MKQKIVVIIGGSSGMGCEWSNWLIGKHAAPKVRDGGSITFTAGTGGRAQEISASYVANLGIGALVQGLASELAPRVRVNAVSPTFMGIGTAFWKDVPSQELEKTIVGFTNSVPLERLATVEEVAWPTLILWATVSLLARCSPSTAA